MRRAVDDVGVVGGGHDCPAGLPVGRDEADDGRPGAAVLADGRLVREQHRWAVVQGRGHGEPALLAARELARVGRLEVAQPEGCEQGAGPVGGGASVSSAAPLPCACSRDRAVVSTSSSTVRATIVELDHCGTHARVRARSGALSGRGPSRRPRRGPLTAAIRTAWDRSVRGSRRARAARSTCPTRSARRGGQRARRCDEGLREHGGPAGRPVPSTSRCARRRRQARGALDDERDGRERRTAAESSRRDERGVDGHRRRAAQRRVPRCPWRAAGRARSSGSRAPARRRRPGRPPRARPAGRRGRPRARARARRRPGSARGGRRSPSPHRRGPPPPSATRPRRRAPPGPIAGSSIAVGSSSEHDRRVERERAGERQPLGLPAGQRRRRGVERQVTEADRSRARRRRRPPCRRAASARSPGRTRRRARPRPRPPRHPGSCSTSPTAPGRSPGGTPSTVTAPVSSPASTVSSRPGEGAQQRRLAGPGRPDQQHPLARQQGERDVAQHRLAATERPPGECRRPRPAPAR